MKNVGGRVGIIRMLVGILGGLPAMEEVGMPVSIVGGDAAVVEALVGRLVQRLTIRRSLAAHVRRPVVGRSAIRQASILKEIIQDSENVMTQG